MKKKTLHQQFDKISLCFSPKAKEKNRLIALRAKQISFVNRRLAAGKLAIDFKNPWNYLAEMPAEARGEAPSEANSGVNQLWWCLLEKVRTHFEQNPE